MAKPAGAIEPGEWTLPLCYTTSDDTFYTEDEPCYMYFVFRLPYMPKWLCTTPSSELGFDGTTLPRRVLTTQEVWIDGAGVTLYTEGRSAEPSTLSWTQDHTGDTDPPDWKTEKEDTNYPTGAIPFTAMVDAEPDPPLIGVLELKLWSDAAGADGAVELCAVNIATKCDTADSNTIQYYSLTTRMHDPDYPADAHMVCDELISAYTRLIYENCPAFSLPVHGRAIPDPA